MIILPWVFKHYGLGFNNTDSMPHRAYLIHKRKSPELGSYVVFSKETRGILLNDAQFVKQVAGTAGGMVRIGNTKLYINSKFRGELKAKTKNGKKLSPGYQGEIPEGFYFVWTPHPDSFDSRYAQMGLVHEDEIIGVAYPLW